MRDDQSEGGRWVLLSYRLPRQPSTPRIALWRKLRRLGVVQLTDGLVALPLDARNREHLEWLADEVVEAGGESGIWLASPTSPGQHELLARRMAAAIVEEYVQVIREAAESHDQGAAARRRTLRRLRRELSRIRQRDHFPPPEAAEARAAVEALATSLEVAE